MNFEYNEFSIDKDDETFRFLYYEWDITKMLEYAQKNNKEVFEVKVDQLKGQNALIRIEEEYAMKTDLEKPIILVELYDKSYFLVDGHHRLHKAIAKSVEYINAYMFSFEEQIRFLTSRSLFNDSVTRYKEHRIDLKTMTKKELIGYHKKGFFKKALVSNKETLVILKQDGENAFGYKRYSSGSITYFKSKIVKLKNGKKMLYLNPLKYDLDNFHEEYIQR